MLPSPFEVSCGSSGWNRNGHTHTPSLNPGSLGWWGAKLEGELEEQLGAFPGLSWTWE